LKIKHFFMFIFFIKCPTFKNKQKTTFKHGFWHDYMRTLTGCMPNLANKSVS